jgi:hypothetical protein
MGGVARLRRKGEANGVEARRRPDASSGGVCVFVGSGVREWADVKVFFMRKFINFWRAKYFRWPRGRKPSKMTLLLVTHGLIFSGPRLATKNDYMFGGLINRQK